MNTKPAEESWSLAAKPGEDRWMWSQAVEPTKGYVEIEFIGGINRVGNHTARPIER